MPPFWIFGAVFLGLAYLTYNYFLIDYMMKYSQQADFDRNCVRVAVFENVPIGVYNGTQKPREIINSNLEKYVTAVKLAAKNVSGDKSYTPY